MVVVLLLILFLGLVSVGLWAYTRTLLTSAAADAARYIANADVSPNAASGKVADLLGGGLPGATRSTLRCTSGADGRLVQVSCQMRAPGIIGLFDGVLPDLSVTGHSVRETRG